VLNKKYFPECPRANAPDFLIYHAIEASLRLTMVADKRSKQQSGSPCIILMSVIVELSAEAVDCSIFVQNEKHTLYVGEPSRLSSFTSRFR
jgi:uncharacterized protein YaiI (UPF0178 family)